MDANQLATECVYKICKVCKEEKKSFNSGKYPNGKDTRFVDENGKEWNGRTCPACHSTINAKRQMYKRKLYV